MDNLKIKYATYSKAVAPQQTRMKVPGWAGIVYGPRASTGCNVESPIPRVRAYRGPCRSGWVSSRYVTPIAG